MYCLDINFGDANNPEYRQVYLRHRENLMRRQWFHNALIGHTWTHHILKDLNEPLIIRQWTCIALFRHNTGAVHNFEF